MKQIFQLLDASVINNQALTAIQNNQIKVHCESKGKERERKRERDKKREREIAPTSMTYASGYVEFICMFGQLVLIWGKVIGCKYARVLLIRVVLVYL